MFDFFKTLSSLGVKVIGDTIETFRLIDHRSISITDHEGNYIVWSE